MTVPTQAAEMDIYGYDECKSIASFIQTKIDGFVPEIAIVCGSGLGGLADDMKDIKTRLNFADIPNYPRSTVQGHGSELVFGTIASRKVCVITGRIHAYEGHDLTKVVAAVRIMKLLGAQLMIASNAAGSINNNFKLCDVMLIKDHINFLHLSGKSPLNGINDDRFGPRFPPSSKAYSPDMLKLAREVLKTLPEQKYFREGVYCGVGGPAYESIAEVKMLQTVGGDAVGMSTVNEVLAAAHCGMKVLAFSLLTNCAITDYEDTSVANHEEVLESAKIRSKDIRAFLNKFLESLPEKL